MFDIGKVPSVGVVVLIACSALIYFKIQDFLFRTWLNYAFELIVSKEEFKHSKLELVIIVMLI